MTEAMATVPQIALAAVGGAAIGSFLNVVIHRLPRRESISTGRSRCPGCGNQIAAYDNVPIVSWLVLRGRCRRCRTRISPRYPLVELLTAVVFAAVVAVRGADSGLLLELPFAAMLIAVAGIDLEHKIVPNRILLPAAVWALVAAAVVATPDLAEYALAGAIAFLALLLAALAYPAGMGMGDVKLAGVMGLYLGLATAPALLAAFLAGSVVGLVLVARHRAARGVGVPFAPFLALGGLIGLLAGPELIELYSDRFLA
jgi:leader peptidase (prepilin peptidase) / N-methyltransferase